MKWATRKNMQVDRAASVWLIRKFIDENAKFEFIDEDKMLEYTKRGIYTFDAKDAKFKHLEDEHGGKYGEKCTFQILMTEYSLENIYPELDYMAKIIYAADIGHRIDIFSPMEGYGLWALTKGLSISIPNDSDKIDLLMDMFDALYAYCRFSVNRSQEYNS